MLTFHCCLTHSCHQGPQEGRRAHLRFIKVCLGGGEQRRLRCTICQFHLISGNTFKSIQKKQNTLVASCLYSGYVSGSGCCLPELWSSKEMLSPPTGQQFTTVSLCTASYFWMLSCSQTLCHCSRWPQWQSVKH